MYVIGELHTIQKHPLLVRPAMTGPLLDIGPVCLAGNDNVQAFAAVDALDKEIRLVGFYKFPLLIAPAMTRPLLDIGPVCLAGNDNVQAFGCDRSPSWIVTPPLPWARR